MDIAATLQAICIHHLAHARDSYFNKLHCKKKLIWAECVTHASFVQEQHSIYFQSSYGWIYYWSCKFSWSCFI